MLGFVPLAGQIRVGMAVAGLYFIILLVTKPFAIASDDKLSQLCQAGIILSLMAAQIFSQYNVSGAAYDEFTDYAVTAALVVLFVLFVLVFVRQSLQIVYRSILQKCVKARDNYLRAEASKRQASIKEQRKKYEINLNEKRKNDMIARAEASAAREGDNDIEDESNDAEKYDSLYESAKNKRT